MLIIGSHVGYKKDSGLVGSVKEALSYNANTFMFYTGAPQNTKRLPIDLEKVKEADQLMKDNKIAKENVIVHAPYIINLATDDLVKREFDEGHYVANHGYSHKYSTVYASPEATLNEYNYTEDAIRKALGNNSYMSKLFRFPGGSNGGYYDEAKQNSKALLHENGIMHLDWNSLSSDAAGAKTKEALLQNVKDTMGEKDSVVILMHDSSDKILTYEMLSDLISYLREQGYKFENIYDLLD